ncbi:hypothetical protein Mapa_011567 [Marchantia paleacea]|nr:hypothetical protein Mapa_011567 [Marchantia paleacea]
MPFQLNWCVHPDSIREQTKGTLAYWIDSSDPIDSGTPAIDLGHYWWGCVFRAQFKTAQNNSRRRCHEQSLGTLVQLNPGEQMGKVPKSGIGPLSNPVRGLHANNVIIQSST